MTKRYQQSLKRPRVGHPIDLPERMLDELSRLFFAEAAQLEKDALVAYLRGNWARGARLELAIDGLRFDSKEIADLAFVKFRDRVAHEERNLAPWERREAEVKKKSRY